MIYTISHFQYLLNEMPASAHLYNLLNNKLLPVTIMIIYSTVYMLWKHLKHEGFLFCFG